MSVNKICLLGNVTADPEIRATNNGKEIANFSIATSEKWKAQDGTKQEKTQFHRISAFGGVVNVIKNYVKKGSKLYIEGSMEYGSYEKEGHKVYTATVMMSGFGSKLELLDSRDKEEYQPTKEEVANNNKGFEADDDIPF